MVGGHIDGREIDALTINADDVPTLISIDGGYRICLKRGHTRVTLPGNRPFTLACVCAEFRVRAHNTSYSIPANRGCLA